MLEMICEGDILLDIGCGPVRAIKVKASDIPYIRTHNETGAFQPIELNDELLATAGFSKLPNMDYASKSCGQVGLGNVSDIYVSAKNINKVYGTDKDGNPFRVHLPKCIKYYHELQHILRILGVADDVDNIIEKL